MEMHSPYALAQNVDVQQLAERGDPVLSGAGSAKMLVSEAFHDAKVLLVGFMPKDLDVIREKLCSLGVQGTASVANSRQLQDMAFIGLPFTHVLINVDAFEDAEACVEGLMNFRACAQDTALVACSAWINEDDLSDESISLCDVTLKLPICTDSLVYGLISASLTRFERS